MSSHISEIIFRFCVTGNIEAIVPYGSGHINDTYYLKPENPQSSGYLLQRINHHVFQNVETLMKNIQLVTGHLKEKISRIADADPDKEVLTVVLSTDGRPFYHAPDGSYWRMYHFLKDTKSYDLVLTEQQAYEGGKGFGKFQLLLSDMDANLLEATIPGFHDIGVRLNQLADAAAADPASRVKDLLPEMTFVRERSDAMTAILNWGKEGRLPLRVTHNDTKFNNILLDQDDRAQCVIDLDTVMPGYVAYDFGDAIRTIINTAPEDEPELTKIGLNMPLFKAYTAGYLRVAGSFLSAMEIRSLLTGVLLIPYMQGVRFLTDYIQGDVYYKTQSPGHNLQRTRAQFQLLKNLEEKYDVLDQIIQSVVTECAQIVADNK